MSLIPRNYRLVVLEVWVQYGTLRQRYVSLRHRYLSRRHSRANSRVPNPYKMSRMGSPRLRLSSNLARMNPTASRKLLKPLSALREPTSGPPKSKNQNISPNSRSNAPAAAMLQECLEKLRVLGSISGPLAQGCVTFQGTARRIFDALINKF